MRAVRDENWWGVQVPLAWQSGSSRAAVAFVESDLVSEARIRFSEWGSVIVRLWKAADSVEVEWTVGPVPIEDGIGKEIALRLRSNISSGVQAHCYHLLFNLVHTCLFFRAISSACCAGLGLR
jgi:hypothetical protein